MIEAALVRLVDDVGVLAEEDVVRAFSILKATDLPTYLRLRNAAKKANRDCSVTVLDKLVRAELPGSGDDNARSMNWSLWPGRSASCTTTRIATRRRDPDAQSARSVARVFVRLPGAGCGPRTGAPRNGRAGDHDEIGAGHARRRRHQRWRRDRISVTSGRPL